jgi:predicted  nucleic acid-binding Zn-ribbon protein
MQVKKKAAKKTYSAAKKGFPKTKITTEELKAIVADLAKGHAKTEAALKTAFKTWEAAHAKTEASIDRLSAENRLLAAENRKTSDEVRKTSEAVRELHAEVMETSESVRQLNDTLGGMGGHLGEVIEFIVIPKIRPAINALGNHSFKEITTRKIVETVINDRKRKLTEVDVLLYGDTEAMAVEIKTCLQTSDVDKQLDRLQKLRDHEADADVKGKTLFGAVVGAIVHEPIRTYALKKGLYVIEIREEEDKLDIDKPDTCRKW